MYERIERELERGVQDGVYIDGPHKKLSPLLSCPPLDEINEIPEDTPSGDTPQVPTPAPEVTSLSHCKFSTKLSTY